MRKSRQQIRSNHYPPMSDIKDFHSVKSRGTRSRHMEMPEMGSVDSESNVLSPIKSGGIDKPISRFGVDSQGRNINGRERIKLLEEPSHITVDRKLKELDLEPSEDFGGELSPISRKYRNQVLPPINRGFLVPHSLQSPQKERLSRPQLDFKLPMSNISRPWPSFRSSRQSSEARHKNESIGALQLNTERLPRKLSENRRGDIEARLPNLVMLTERLSLKNSHLIGKNSARGVGRRNEESTSRSAHPLEKYRPLELKVALGHNSVLEYDRRIRKMREELDDMNLQCEN